MIRHGGKCPIQTHPELVIHVLGDTSDEPAVISAREDGSTPFQGNAIRKSSLEPANWLSANLARMPLLVLGQGFRMVDNLPGCSFNRAMHLLAD